MALCVIRCVILLSIKPEGQPDWNRMADGSSANLEVFAVALLPKFHWHKFSRPFQSHLKKKTLGHIDLCLAFFVRISFWRLFLLVMLTQCEVAGANRNMSTLAAELIKY